MIVKIFGLIKEMDDDLAVILIKEGIAFPALRDRIEQSEEQKVDIEA